MRAAKDGADMAEHVLPAFCGGSQTVPGHEAPLAKGLARKGSGDSRCADVPGAVWLERQDRHRGRDLPAKLASPMRCRARASSRPLARRNGVATAMPGRTNSLPTGAAWHLSLIGFLAKDHAARPQCEGERQLSRVLLCFRIVNPLQCPAVEMRAGF
ncbi:MAG: hypothetical protein ACR2KT_10300 [Methylocella sp.]